MTARMAAVVSRFRRAAQQLSGPPVVAGAPVEGAERQACPGLKRALERALRGDAKPHVLDLGPLCGPTVMFLADRGARVRVEELPAPGPPTTAAEGSPAPAGGPFHVPQPTGEFQIVLAWEHCDFVAPDRLPELGAELHRLLAPGGWLVLYSRDRTGSHEPGQDDQPSVFRLVAEDAVVRQPAPVGPRPRWVHPNRALERALAPLSIQGIHLQRDRTREIVAIKPDRPK
jgi:hypothetical protein